MEKKTIQDQDPILSLIGRTHSLVRRSLGRHLDRCGVELTGEQSILLKMLACRETLNQQDLAERLFKDKAGISRLLAGMEQRGLIVRTSTIEDRRNNYVSLSPAGRGILKEIGKPLQMVRSGAVEGIPAKDLEVCRRVLERIIDNLSDDV